MKDLKFFEIIKLNNELESSLKSDIYKISLISNVIVNQLKEIIEYNLRVEGINAIANVGDYDNIIQDSLKFNKSNLVLVFWELCNLSEGIYYSIESYNEVQLEEFINYKKSEIDLVINNLKNTPLVFFNEFNSSPFTNNNSENLKYDFLMSELNDYLRSQLTSNIKLININKIYIKNSIVNSIDFRYFYSSKSLYTTSFYKSYTDLIKPLVLSVKGKSKKALIFDCDNTLWNGVLGEDGFEKIEMSTNSKKGIYFNEVQKIAISLNKKGVLLGICSKNNEIDVQNVIDKHPDFQIENKNIIIKKINWVDKASNIREISEELNIGLDSIVFIDDSPFEVGYVKSQLPQVTVIKVPKILSDYPKMINEVSQLFYNVSLSKEDGNKTEMYQQNIKRKSLEKKFENIDDFLSSLDIRVEVIENDLLNIPRISQLTQKTNQFNLTTKRYTENEIQGFMSSDDYLVYSFVVSDKFGDNGITGLSIVKINDNEAYIDTFLMSCRIIGRKIELSFINLLINELESRGINTIRASYIKSQKNSQVKSFYSNFNFNETSFEELKTNYDLEISNYKLNKIKHIKINLNGK
jgi:FkbH-like protein